jgi:hypothetical protein
MTDTWKITRPREKDMIWEGLAEPRDGGALYLAKSIPDSDDWQLCRILSPNAWTSVERVEG